MSQFYLDSSGANPPSSTSIDGMGFDLTSGRFQIVHNDGSALSSINKATVSVAVKGSLGQYQRLTLDKPYKIDDDSHATLHDMEGWHPFWATTDNWNQDRPYFVYVIAHDTATSDPAVGISQCPNFFTSPAAASINVSGTINSNDQASMLLFEISDGAGGWTTPTIANYDANPCVCVGSIRMQVSDTTNDDQTIQTLNDTDGVGRFQEGVVFTCPPGTIGSFPAFFATDPGAGGDIAFSNGSATYRIERSGMCDFASEWNTLTSASTNTGDLAMLMPYYINGINTDDTIGRVRLNSDLAYAVTADPTSGARVCGQMQIENSASEIQNNTLASGDSIGIKYRYLAFAN